LEERKPGRPAEVGLGDPNARSPTPKQFCRREANAAAQYIPIPDALVYGVLFLSRRNE